RSFFTTRRDHAVRGWPETRRKVTAMRSTFALIVLVAAGAFGLPALADAQSNDRAALDARVRRFLDDRAATWRDLNVPPQDGQLLHDLIVEHGYTRALEIGTSTGHSGV